MTAGKTSDIESPARRVGFSELLGRPTTHAIHRSGCARGIDDMGVYQQIMDALSAPCRQEHSKVDDRKYIGSDQTGPLHPSPHLFSESKAKEVGHLPGQQLDCGSCQRA